MKSSHFYTSVAVSVLCLLLSLTVVIMGTVSQRMQTDRQRQQTQLQAQQEQINAGNVISQQVGPSLLRDLATVSVEDGEMKDLLAKHGYTVNIKDPPAGEKAPAGGTPK